MADIKHKLVINTESDKVYKDITAQEGLANWWTKETKAKPEVGFTNVFSFNGQFVTDMKVTKLITGKKVEWECTNGFDEWIGTKVSFELEEMDNKTTLLFVHSGWKEQTDFFNICNRDWGKYLNSLKSLCETGKGMPHS